MDSPRRAIGSLLRAAGHLRGSCPGPRAGTVGRAAGQGFVPKLYEDRIVGTATAAYGAHGQNAALILMPHQAEAGDELPLLAT